MFFTNCVARTCVSKKSYFKVIKKNKQMYVVFLLLYNVKIDHIVTSVVR